MPLVLSAQEQLNITAIFSWPPLCDQFIQNQKEPPHAEDYKAGIFTNKSLFPPELKVGLDSVHGPVPCDQSFHNPADSSWSMPGDKDLRTMYHMSLFLT